MKKRSSEFHAGARYERAAILRFVRQLHKKLAINYGVYSNEFCLSNLGEIKQFIQSRKDRYRKLEGGL